MKLRYLIGLAIAAIPLTAAPQTAACDRECLRGFVTRFLNSMVIHQSSELPMAADFRFTEDNVEMKLAASPLWTNTSRIRDYRLDILDVRDQVAASQVIVEEAGEAALLMLRLKIRRREIAEADTEITRNKEEGSLFKPETLKYPSAAMQMIPNPEARNSRPDMIRIAELYPAGLKAGSFVTVDTPFASDTYRLENGQLMAGPGCTFLKGCENIKTQKIPTLSAVRYRVAAVDEDRAIVLLQMDFGPGSTRVAGHKLMVWEAFKVYGGQIHAVEAFMKNVPLSTSADWESQPSQ